MITKRNLLVAAALLLVLTTACSKDVLREKMLVGTWTVQEYKVGGVDLLVDSLLTDFDLNSVVKTKFSSAQLIFKDNGNFTQEISYGARISDGSNSLSISDYDSESSGTWSDLNADLSLSFETAFDASLNSVDFLTAFTSPTNSVLITGDSSLTTTSEVYDILKLTNTELEMQSTNSVNQIINIRASQD